MTESEREAELGRLKETHKSRRTAYKGKVTTLRRSAEPFVTGARTYDEVSVSSYLKRLEDYKGIIENLDREISECCTDKIECDTHNAASIDYIDELCEFIENLRQKRDSHHAQLAQDAQQRILQQSVSQASPSTSSHPPPAPVNPSLQSDL